MSTIKATITTDGATIVPQAVLLGKVAKDDIGLSNVDNTSDLNKPISIATQNALTSIENTLNTDLADHINDINNPHSVTAAQLNLDNVDNTSDLNKPISTATQNALDTKPSSSDFDNIVKIAQGAYDLITPDPNTLYVITI